MITVDEAITRATLTWRADRTHVENETAYQDRTILAAEVVALKEALAEAEAEVRRSNWM